MDEIMALKDHVCFDFVHDSKFPWLLKDKAFVVEVLVVLPQSGVELVKSMQVCLSIAIGGGDDISGGEDLNPRDCALKGSELFEHTNGN